MTFPMPNGMSVSWLRRVVQVTHLLQAMAKLWAAKREDGIWGCRAQEVLDFCACIRWGHLHRLKLCPEPFRLPRGSSVGHQLAAPVSRGAPARWHGRGGSRQWAPAPIAGEGLDVWWQCFFWACSAGDPFHQLNWSTLSLSLPRLRLFCRMGYINFKLQGNTASGDVEWDSMRLAMSPGWKGSSEPAWRGPCLWPGEISKKFVLLYD